MVIFMFMKMLNRCISDLYWNFHRKNNFSNFKSLNDSTICHPEAVKGKRYKK